MKKNKKILGIVLSLFMTLVLFVSCGDDSSSSEVKEGTKKESYKIGEVADIKDSGIKLQVAKVERSNGKDFDEPSKGKQYIIVSVRIKNNSEDTVSYNPYDFTMQNSDGQIEDTAFTTIDQDTSLNSGELAPGGLVTGTVTYEQPKKDKKLVLIYDTNSLFGGEQYKIDLSKKLDSFKKLK